jgi:hypothetical protein
LGGAARRGIRRTIRSLEIAMNAPVKRTLDERAGKIKYGILAWMLGLPLPIVILALFFRGCDF